MDYINSITQTIPDTNEEHNTTTVYTDGGQIDEHQTDDEDGLEASHQDAYVEHSSRPENLDHNSGTSDMDYWDDDV